uniref:Uncharacterized protein n=1 Tax=Ditylenchus dipsaci TaxID=166011 RepID=A0A915CKD7_9BILA
MRIRPNANVSNVNPPLLISNTKMFCLRVELLQLLPGSPQPVTMYRPLGSMMLTLAFKNMDEALCACCDLKMG